MRERYQISIVHEAQLLNLIEQFGKQTKEPCKQNTKS